MRPQPLKNAQPEDWDFVRAILEDGTADEVVWIRSYSHKGDIKFQQ